MKLDSRKAFFATGVGYEYRRDTMKLVTTPSIAIADPVVVVPAWPARADVGRDGYLTVARLREDDRADLINLDSASVRSFWRVFKDEAKVRGAKPEQGVVA
ncbi:hypothetical protein [Mycobacterium sp.]|uniref:hypothetical protein n=1 Tax=Mycobacterium sp. TaxID=1785 RepID=UPI003BAED531